MKSPHPREGMMFCHLAPLNISDSSRFPSPSQKRSVPTSCFLFNSWHLSFSFLLACAILCVVNISFVPFWKCPWHCRLPLVLEFPVSTPIAEISLGSLGGRNKVGIPPGFQTFRKITVLLIPPSSTREIGNAFSLLWHLCWIPPITLKTEPSW